MSIGYQILLLFIAAAAVLFCLWRFVFKAKLNTSIAVALIVGLLFIETTPIWAINLVPQESMIVSNDNGQIVAMLPSIGVWKWDKRLEGAKIIGYFADTKKVSMRFNPITENPKVRDLHYEVELEIRGTPQDALAWQKTIGTDDTETWLKYQLYEFNEANSKAAAKFYNPLSPLQQAEFKKLMKTFLEPRLQGKGMRLKDARFSLP